MLRSNRRARRASAHSPGLHPLDERRLLAASTDGVGTKLILARERGASSLRRRPRRALHQRRDHDRRRAAVPPRLRRREPDRARPGRRARRGDGRGLPSGRLRAPRRRDRRAAGDLPRRASSTSPGRASASSTASACSTARRSRPATSWSASRRPASTRTASRSSARSSSTRTTTATTCSRRRGSTSTTSRRLREHAHAFAHVTGGGIEGNLRRVIPDGLELPRSTGTRGSGRRSSSGSPGTPKSRSCAASSTSGSATARCCRRATDGLVIGHGRVIGVLVSGEGSNLQALLDAGLPIAAVASNRADARALAAREARRSRDGGLSRSTATRAARRATPRWPTGSRTAASTLGRARGLHAPAAPHRSSRASPSA